MPKDHHKIFIHVLLVIVLTHTCQKAICGNYTLSDTAKVKEQIKLSRDSVNTNPNKSLQFSDSAINISKIINYPFGLASALNAKGYAMKQIGKSNDAINLLKESINISKENNFSNNLAAAYTNLAIVYDDIGDYQHAFENCQEAIKIYEKGSDSLSLANTYVDIGTIFFHMEYYDQANENFFKAEILYSALNMRDRTASVFNNIAATYIVQKNYVDAFSYLFQSVQISDSMNRKDPLPIAFMNLGLCYNEVGKKDSALYYYFKSLNAFREIVDPPNEIGVLNNIGSVYLDLKDTTEAAKYLKECYDLSKANAYLEGMYLSSGGLANIYLMNRDYKKASEFLQIELNANDSLVNQDKTNAIAELTTRYGVNELENKNALLQKEVDLQKLRLLHKDFLLYGSLGVAILLMMISVLMINQNRLRVGKQRVEMEQERLRAQMNPHFIFNSLNSIQHFIAHNDVINANQYLTRFAWLMRHTLEDTKDGMINLRNELEYLEYYLSLEHMRFENKLNYSVTCETDIDVDEIEIPSMIIQPFVENAIKHGLCYLEDRVGVLKISFYKKDNCLYCEIDDNGIGRKQSGILKKQSNLTKQSYGIALTRQRLLLAGKHDSKNYEITIIDKMNQQQSQGTTVIIKFPLEG